MTTIANSTEGVSLHKADRLGVAVSVLCAIHCGMAPVLLLFLPAFGEVWAHPASHALVALFIVPLAVFSICKGYRIHQKRWVALCAFVGIFLVSGGAALPAFGKQGGGDPNSEAAETVTHEVVEGAAGEAKQSSCSSSCASSCAAEATSESSTGLDELAEGGCVDECCPSLIVSEAGVMSLHVPPAAIITTLGGFFLIAAHVGNLCGCRHGCRTKTCCHSPTTT
ncbi:MAG: MerC domain-containing protein [Rubritalea sp.]|uniref:MerC domain-containing protein n=1 Tax=Rubritalea sp. TaxID=2109375 RepID=UPI0032422890